MEGNGPYKPQCYRYGDHSLFYYTVERICMAADGDNK